MTELDKVRSGSIEEYFDISISQDILSRCDSSTSRRSDIPRPRHLRHRGIAYIWMAIFLLLFILLVGLTLDTAKVFLVAHQLQNAADAAALAGAQLVKTDQTQARIQAQKLSEANYYADGNSVKLDPNPSNAENGDIVIGLYFPQYGSFVPSAAGQFANAVKVVPRCIDGQANPPVSLNFGPIAGVNTANVARYAIAMASGGTGAGLIALDCGSSCEDARPGPCGGTPCSGPNKEGGPGLQLVGCSIVDVGGGPVLGEVVVNCSSCDHPKPAVSLGGCATIENAAQMNIVGCYDGPETDYPISDNDPCNYMPDPLGCFPNYECLMPRLSADPDNDLSPDPNNCAPWTPDPNTIDTNATDPNFTLSPGYYSGGINITTAPYPVIFQPGIYILDGEICSNINAKGGLKINGGIIDAGNGVMFYILGGSVDIGGNPILTMNELVPWVDDKIAQPYEGMLFYQDPDNCTPARIIGTSDVLFVGTLYFPFNEIEIGGDGYAVGSQLIANSITIHTSGEGVVINYDGRNRAPGGKSYLVK